ncbi:MAG: 50S ribosomal protein L23 [Candidatus Omnitrophica bacterium]|nr:50S ribosomal protein L23 [Candidatus Omnitrophota bacterium]MDD5574312.1 50S ribosomal protein L23 [Candidatus Omnitrophota bacterium]
MHNPYDIIKTLIHSEKGSRLEPDGCYQFYVASNASKVDIKRAVEKIYKVKVRDVNTMIVLGKMKRIRTQLGKQPDWKKAFVRLEENQKIDSK